MKKKEKGERQTRNREKKIQFRFSLPKQTYSQREKIERAIDIDKESA